MLVPSLAAGHVTQLGESILKAIVSYQFPDLGHALAERRSEDRPRLVEGVDGFPGSGREELLELCDCCC